MTLTHSKRSFLPAARLAVFCFLICAAATARAQSSPRAYSESPLPAPTGYVNDYANVIDEATESRLETILTGLKERANIEFAVVTVQTTGGTPIFDYTLSVARGWGIGAKEGERAGGLLLVAVADRKYYTQVSRHLEGDLPDGVLGEIQRTRFVPQARQGNYSKGISDTMEAYVATLAEKRGFSVEGIDQSYAHRPATRATRTTRTGQSRSSLSAGACCCIGAVVLLVLLSMFSGKGRGGRGGRGGWGGGGGLLNALLLANIFSSLGGSGRSSSSGWGGFGGGGSSGGGSGWGGGGFGGFGGGGDFGGGGAGGDW